MAPTESNDAQAIYFDGSNWEALSRLSVQATMEFLLDPEKFDGEDGAKCAFLVKGFRGPALDWVGARLAVNATLFQNYDQFLGHVRNAFGVSDDGLRAHRRGQLEALQWQADLPVFFADFDRLVTSLDMGGDATRIALLRNKLPVSVQKLLAEQALDFRNYDTMRERLLTMWALDPHKHTTVTPGSSNRKRAKCGRCGKKGHTAPDCRAAKN